MSEEIKCPENVGSQHIYRFKDGKFTCRCGRQAEYRPSGKDFIHSDGEEIPFRQERKRGR